MTPPSNDNRSKAPRLGFIILIGLAMAVGGYLYNQREVNEIKAAKDNELQVISQFKVSQIVAWRKERRTDAHSNSSGIIRQDILEWLASAPNPGLESQIKSYLDLFREAENYQNMIITDPDGRLLISLDPDLKTLLPQTADLARQVAATRDIAIGNIFRSPSGDHLFMDVAAPILDGKRQTVAVLILRTDPEDFLFPLIQTWPTPSKSAETLIVCKNDDDVLFITGLRHHIAPPMSVSIPITQTDVPAVQAVMGRTGIFEGKDYRGVDVVADLRAVPDSPWFMIAKVDSDEVFAEARFHTSVIVLLVGLGLLLTAIVTAFVDSQQRKNLFIRLYGAERERREAQEEIRATLYGIGDGVLAADAHGCVTRMNPVAEHLTGWGEAEALGKPLSDIFRIINEDSRAEVENPVARVLRDGQVVGLANHTLLIARDGIERPIADSAAPIVTEAGIIGVALVFRDQTEERAAQNALREREAFARSVLDAVGANVAVLDQDGTIQATNNAWHQFARENRGQADIHRTGEGMNYLAVTAAATGPSSENAAEALAGIRQVLDGSRQEFTIEYPCHSPNVQRWFMMRATPLEGGKGGAVLAHIDITYRTMLEMRRELAIQVLIRLNEDQETAHIIGDILSLIKEHTGIEAVGIRLKEGHDFPYHESIGFPKEFIQSKSHLAVLDASGELIRDDHGAPMLACLCGDVLGRSKNPHGTSFSPNGSFWTNSTSTHITFATMNARQTPLRDCCLRQGYESLALIPVRVGQTVIGLIHLADHRQGMFSREMIEFFEGIGASIGIALAHRHAIDEIRLNRERLEKAQEVGHLGSWEYDLHTQRIWASSEGYRLFGLAPEGDSLPIEQIEECITERERVHQALIDLIEGGKPYALEYRIEPADGSAPRYILSKAELARGEQDQPVKVVGVLQDITKRKQAEDQIQAAHQETQRLLDQAEQSRKVLLSLIEDQKRTEAEKESLQGQFLQSQKMESIGRLAGGVAHDFNNMLQVILGHTAVAMEMVDPDQSICDHLTEIQNAAQRSADLTRQLLAFARKQTIMPRILDLNQTVSGMLKMLQRMIGEDIELIWKPGLDLRPVRMDPSQIDQILANLSVNARDAITENGNLTIETKNVAFDVTYCASHSGFVPGEYVMLAVSDTGAGMDKATVDRLFEPFFTTKELGKGTGLGLATVYGIVKQNNGFINVYSEPGQGTAIKIYLPSLNVEAIETTSMEDSQPANGTEMILVVEDEVSILNLAREILQNYGYTVLAAATPGEALELAERHRGLIELLITDVVMPQMNGRDLKELIVGLQPGIKALYMSGYTANVIAHHGVIDEGVEFLQKPFSVRKLANKVREVLDGGPDKKKKPGAGDTQ